MGNKRNDAARDLWAQMYERAARHPGAAVIDPKYDPREDEARARAGFSAAGWNNDAIDEILASRESRYAAAPSTSPGVNRAVEALHAQLCDDVEAEMARQGLVTQQHVARGIEPITGPFASKAGVIMTEQSIITVGAFTFRFCGLVAKAFHHTFMLDPYYWESDQFTSNGARRLMRQNRSLAWYWHQIFLSFAMTGTNGTVPFKASGPKQVILVEQIARAMEIFIVAHEYGHHHHGHGRDVAADGWADEFAADQFALNICRPIGERDRLPIWNPYLASGAGGVIVLKALETLRQFEQAVGAKLAHGNTHPRTDERLAQFDSVAAIEPQAFGTLQGYRIASARVMDTVNELLVEALGSIPDHLKTSLIKLRRRIWDELP